MGSQTSLGYPYPVGTDRVMDGDDAIKALAEAVNAKLGILASGTATVTVTTGGTPASLSVTFPVGRFSAAPNVVAGVGQSQPNAYQAGSTGATATGFTAWGVRGAAGPVNVPWIAHQGV